MSDEESAIYQQKEEPKKKRKRCPPNAKVPAWIVWSRSIGAVSVLAGGFGLLQPQYFWFGVSFVYGGFVLLGVDLWFEPQLKRGSKIAGEGLLALGMVLFSLKVVFVSAPLNIASVVTALEYSAGTKIADIPWRPMYAELDVVVSNPTGGDYTDVNERAVDFPQAQAR